MKKSILFLMILGFVSVKAQDRLFTYTYQSGVLNKGQKEIEVWTTFKNGRENFYRAVTNRMEFEVGLGSKLQTSFYLNHDYGKGITEQNSIQSLTEKSDFSFSNEWKLKLSDPLANALGTGLYFEYTLAPGETELEGKIIFDKQMGRFTNAFNLVGEWEIEKAFSPEGNLIKAENEKEFTAELNYGLSYRVNNGFHIGLEAMNQNQFKDSKLEHSVLLAGPSISWTSQGFWLNLTCMPQITDFKSGGLDLADHDRLQTRLIFSYAF